MKEIKAPTRIDLSQEFSIFLAGSIEMGKAENWQERIAREFEMWNVTLLNPRRDDWDSSWEQKKENQQFNEQVTWELDHMELANLVIFYFDPKTKSPITLLELGLNAERDHPSTVIVCCPDGFWRKGNIEVVCEHYGLSLVDNIDDLIRLVKGRLLRGKVV
jgi:hypothetical protein